MGKEKTCSFEGCSDSIRARGLCAKHYNFMKNRGMELPPRERLWRGVPCLVDGCERPARGSGYCGMHYHRKLRHGDPLAGKTFHGAPKEWMDAHLNYDGDDCLKWPFDTDDRGCPWINLPGKIRQSAGSYVCEAEHGPKPTEGHEAAHNCGNGREGCVNHKHLRWATRQENSMDMFIHGTDPSGDRHPQAKLTWPDVREIRRLRGSISQMELGRRYGVTNKAISAIQLWKNWRRDPLLTVASPSSSTISCRP